LAGKKKTPFRQKGGGGGGRAGGAFPDLKTHKKIFFFFFFLWGVGGAPKTPARGEIIFAWGAIEIHREGIGSKNQDRSISFYFGGTWGGPFLGGGGGGTPLGGGAAQPVSGPQPGGFRGGGGAEGQGGRPRGRLLVNFAFGGGWKGGKAGNPSRGHGWGSDSRATPSGVSPPPPPPPFPGPAGFWGGLGTPPFAANFSSGTRSENVFVFASFALGGGHGANGRRLSGGKRAWQKKEFFPRERGGKGPSNPTGPHFPFRGQISGGAPGKRERGEGVLEGAPGVAKVGGPVGGGGGPRPNPSQAGGGGGRAVEIGP